MVGLGRLELPTSRLSGVRSNHLSYEPETLHKAVSGSLRQDNRKSSRKPCAPSRKVRLDDEKGRETKATARDAVLSSEMSRDDVSVVSKTSSLERR